MALSDKTKYDRSVASEFTRVDRTSLIHNSAEKLKSELLNYMSIRLEEFSSEMKQTTINDDIIRQTIINSNDIKSPDRIGNESSRNNSFIENSKKKTSPFPSKTFYLRSSILTDLLEISHIRSIRQIFIAILVIVFLQVAITDLFELGTIDFRFDVILWNFSNLSACIQLWFCLFISTCTIVYYCFHLWAYKRLCFISKQEKSIKNPILLRIFDWTCLIAYSFYIGLFLYIPVYYILTENYPIVTRIIILIEQVRFLMKSHAFVRENIPRATRYGQMSFEDKKNDDKVEDLLNDSSDSLQQFYVPCSPCPEFSKFLYFLFTPTLIYRDSYPRTSSIRWKYVLSQLAQFIAAVLFSYYLFYRFCLPVFRHFKSEHVTIKKFVLSILNCTLPGALLLFCSFYGFLHCWLNAFAEMLRFGDRQFYSDWWTSTSWTRYYRTWNIVVHDWLYTYIYRDCHKLLGVKYRLVSMYTVIFLSACVHEYILAFAFGYFYPILFLQFAILGCISMLILPQRTENNAFNIFIWVSLFVGFGMQMCLYSIEWYARQNCPQTINGPLDYFVPRSFFCRDGNEI